jgi:hypothetical protein
MGGIPEASQVKACLQMWDYLANARQFLGKNRAVLADRQIQNAQKILTQLMQEYGHAGPAREI